MINDEVLIQQFAKGDNRAFDILVKKYHPNIYWMALHYVKDCFLAEDLAQEALIKILMSIRKEGYRQQGKFLSWALQITANHCIDYLRKNKRKKFPDLTVAYHAVDPEQIFIQKQISEKLLSSIDQLPSTQRELVYCKYFGEMKFKDIAAISGTSINTATGRMRYALSNLRKLKAAG